MHLAIAADAYLPDEQLTKASLVGWSHVGQVAAQTSESLPKFRARHR
jgi:hypothetical protein